MGNEGQQDRGVLMPPQILTQPPPSGTVGSVDQRCHLWETGHPEGLDWVGLGWVTSGDPSQPPHRGGITKGTRKCAPPLFGAKQEDPAWEDTALGSVYPALDLQSSLPALTTLGFSVHALTSRTAGTQPDLMSGKRRL